jgi:para-nitrobenzyl esterase
MRTVGPRRCCSGCLSAAVLLLLAALAVAGCSGSSGSSPAPSPSQRASLEQPVVDGGPIRGERAPGTGVWSYLGVPYAAPPVGDLRWRPPRPVQPWENPRACTAYGPSCSQPRSVLSGRLGRVSEDCLYLNVWTPAASPQERLPVMVWIHGGSFVTGSGSEPVYAGANLARAGDVVVVTVNYRLGPLGFLALPELSAESPEDVSGNYGLLDQMAALRWVRGNIAAFGGDPERVTAFGESAGAISILNLMASPLATGLFQRAIAESAILQESGMGVRTSWPLAEAERAGEAYARRLGVSGPDVLQALRELPAERLLAEAGESADVATAGLAWKPVVDGYVLPASVTGTFAAGEQMEVPLLVGSNSDESNLWAPFMGAITVDQYRAFLKAGFGDGAADIWSLYPARTDAEVPRAIGRLLTETGFGATARFAASSMDAQGKAPAYLYRFSRAPDFDLPGLKLPIPKGAFHAVEIPYVFGTLGALAIDDPTDEGLSRQMMKLWTTFAATGDPGATGSGPWPPYRRASDEHLELDATIRVESGLYREAADLADELIYEAQ